MNCMSIRPATTHALLGPEFYDPVEAASFPSHILRHRDQRWAARIGLDGLSDAEWIEHMGRFVPLAGSFPEPLALRYHGHQFRNYNPDLGDGRGFLFAQMHDLVDGRLLDLGTKGSGRTPWSRGGDGRLTLKGGVREILATSMLEALGVYTSKSLSLVETGEALERAGLTAMAGRVAGVLSHGQLRQLEIAMVLATEPCVLLLDEPLAGMGPEEAERVAGLLRALAVDHAVLLIEHDMDVVFSVADTLTVMVDGRVLDEGTPTHIRGSARVQDAYLGHAA